MSEKAVEIQLAQYLDRFAEEHIYYSPSENGELKELFKKASKKGHGAGIPDRVYYDGDVLIIIECKSKSIVNAKKDLQLYRDKLEFTALPKINDGLKIYYVAFVQDLYEIFDVDFKRLDFTLEPNNFGIKTSTDLYTNMSRDIHALHNYIRDYTKISNEDKSFFVASILISLQKTSFSRIIDTYDTKSYIYDLIKQNLVDFGIDVSVFEFLRNDENNVHFLNIIKMIKAIYDKNPSADLLNKFYSEFVRYSNSDGKSLGIVLTPDHVVRLMIKMLAITPQDTFLDLCTGTGSFPLEALAYGPRVMVACEYQTKLFGLLKCNMILRGVDFSKNSIFQGDCFEYDFAATKSAINPPYGMRDKKELDFVRLQLDSICDGGLACAIVPCSCLSKSAARNAIFDQALVERIVICNNDLFYPNAGVKTCILLMRKAPAHGRAEQSTILDNYECDGYEIQRNKGRVYVGGERHEETTIEITKDDETWLSCSVERTVDATALKLKLLEIDYHSARLRLATAPMAPPSAAALKAFKIGELFDILKKPKQLWPGPVYEISAKNNNNGIKGIRRTDFAFAGNAIVLVTGGNGGAGLAYYQADPFVLSSATVALVPKPHFQMDKLVGIYVAEELSKYKKKYSRGFQWNLARIQRDTIDLPVADNDDIDYDHMRSFFA